jgi:hypothetical protein
VHAPHAAESHWIAGSSFWAQAGPLVGSLIAMQPGELMPVIDLPVESRRSAPLFGVVPPARQPRQPWLFVSCCQALQAVDEPVLEAQAATKPEICVAEQALSDCATWTYGGTVPGLAGVHVPLSPPPLPPLDPPLLPPLDPPLLPPLEPPLDPPLLPPLLPPLEPPLLLPLSACETPPSSPKLVVVVLEQPVP